MRTPGTELAPAGVRKHVVAVLCLPPLVGYDMSIAPQLFVSARDASGESYYDVRVCSLDGGPVETARGYAVAPHHGPEALAEADTVVVPGTYHPVVRGGELPTDLAAAWATIRPDARLVSICTGAFVLAAAGVLDGLRVTTHWEHADSLAELHPQVVVDPDVLFVDHGQILTSAGLSAGVDLCLHIIRADHGAEVAARVARSAVVPPWREGGQAQFIRHALPQEPEQSTSATREWLRTDLRTVPSVPAMARHARMSERTFTRRFRDETGMSPLQWLQQVRLQRALELLEQTSWTVDRIADEAGLGTAANLRHRMRAVLATSPAAYRRTFRGPRPVAVGDG
ncbi:GlxA family transcriptional regulator [Ornithinimicrobium sp. Y1847]|uniref:GlxA family transcriptional regulator n=1 Tax=Ornithinimicrobium sp. Y1847 TaxID=3405419 RepID=UPI003B66FA08